MSDTPKKIEFMMMNDSAAEFVIASRVAFSVSAPNYTEHSLGGTNESKHLQYHVS